MPLVPAVVVLFALVSFLWFGASFVVLAQGIVVGVAKDQVHELYGYGVAALQAAVVAGWIWALVASIRARSPVNGTVQVMCAATAAAQVAIVLTTVALIGRWIPGGRANLLLGHAAIGALLAVQVGQSQKRRRPPRGPSPAHD
ncbi:hypothetical protein MKK69_04325 [Methylobacterium sp. J-026]|uniref:hypothetical protein n=1 Tax=Methylobacterium sp. J-026 TaxID=2836624 RepID=UPI001FBB6AD6|nr:hypothetical protein [Methylobacterium sp. J-026]MCJ2133298.1 hypothetical protein [Methylobacterium sp. J-026]